MLSLRSKLSQKSLLYELIMEVERKLHGEQEKVELISLAGLEVVNLSHVCCWRSSDEYVMLWLLSGQYKFHCNAVVRVQLWLWKYRILSRKAQL